MKPISIYLSLDSSPPVVKAYPFSTANDSAFSCVGITYFISPEMGSFPKSKYFFKVGCEIPSNLLNWFSLSLRRPMSIPSWFPVILFIVSILKPKFVFDKLSLQMQTSNDIFQSLFSHKDKGKKKAPGDSDLGAFINQTKLNRSLICRKVYLLIHKLFKRKA